MKKFLAIVAAGVALYPMPAAFAGPVSLTGDVSVTYERDTSDVDPTVSSMIYTTKLMGVSDFGSGWSGYVRLGAQHVTKPDFGDFHTDPDAYGPDKKSVIALDQFGLVYEKDNFVYKLGRQDVGVGTTALLYSRADSNIGKKAFVDGLTATGTIGVMDVSALAAQEDNLSSADNKVYAIRAGYSPQENLNYGVTLGRYQGSDIASTNHWAVDGTYTFAKNSLTAEFAKSNSSADNKAYAAIWNYDFDGKTAASITGFRVEDNGSMGGQSDFDAGNRGFHYGITHNLSDAQSLEFVYKAQKEISNGLGNNALELTFSHTF